ncbi:MAG: transporter related [Verrucomicrobia bacterium]|jgi:phospholipid/cholesterol/gamma-HCH transport system ATP-binding protein|nr:transporter related [Verrucomicrobiota bacterium]
MSQASQNQHPSVSVEVKGLRKSFGSVEVLHGIDLNIKAREVFVIMGPSGSGKSVLLKHLIGLETPNSGDVLIDGHSIQAEDMLERYRLAMVFQSGGLLNSLTVAENVGLYLTEHRLMPQKDIDRLVTEKLEALGLKGQENRMPEALSGGMKKRVAIARALVIDPQVILYDEPTSELDPLIAVTIGQEIKRLNQENDVTSIVVTHDRDLAFGIADRIALMYDGKVLEVGTPKELQQSKNEQVQKFLNASFKF